MTRYVVRPSARRDIEDIAVYIGSDSPDAARRFLRQCEETFDWLAGMPRVGRPWRARSRRAQGIRVWAVAGFPNHLVFYRIRARSVLILHVMSGWRDLDGLLDH